MMNIEPAEEESEMEVRRVDQDNINKFARLNARLHELRDEQDLVKVSKLPNRILAPSIGAIKYQSRTVFFSPVIFNIFVVLFSDLF